MRDFLTARTLGAVVCLIPTAWTEQGPGGVRGVEARAPGALGAAIREAVLIGRSAADRRIALSDRAAGRGKAEAVAAPEPVVVVKIGMLPDQAAVAAVIDALDAFDGPVVFDPVIAASSGGTLFAGDPAALLTLGARATLMTPNAAEAAILSGMPVTTEEEAARAAAKLAATIGGSSPGAVLVKGGHLQTESEVVDILYNAGTLHHFRGPRLDGPAIRGTGCALATAIAVGLGRGAPLANAISGAKAWLASALAQAIAVGEEWHLS